MAIIISIKLKANYKMKIHTCQLSRFRRDPPYFHTALPLNSLPPYFLPNLSNHKVKIIFLHFSHLASCYLVGRQLDRKISNAASISSSIIGLNKQKFVAIINSQFLLVQNIFSFFVSIYYLS